VLGPSSECMAMTAKLVDQRWEVNLKRSLGEGGFGQVYRGKDTIASPAVDVAAKRVNLSNEAETKAFLLEISVLRRVSSHPSIITLLGSAQNATHGWMFLEIATGGELFDRLIDSGSLSERAAWPYVKAIAGAIQHCSKHGVIHRDLKLENVMLCAENPYAVRIIDFGLAVQLPLTKEGTPDSTKLLTDAAGTQAYRAPEISNAGYDPAKVDVWALGIVTFSLASGFFPVQEAKEDDWRYSQMAKDQADGMGCCESIYKLYKRKCPFSPTLVEAIDGMLRIDQIARWDIEQVCNCDWILMPPGGIYPGEEEETIYRGLSSCEADLKNFHLPPDAVPVTRQRAVRNNTAYLDDMFVTSGGLF